MSDTWIESHAALRNHPKVGRLARKLRIPRMQAIGILHAFWWWALEYAEDGDLSRSDTDDIAAACEWEDGNALLDALRHAGFVDDLMIHDWWDYTGRLLSLRAERRAKTRERVTRYRERRNALRAQCNADVTRLCNADVTHLSNAPVTHLTLPNPTLPNQTNGKGTSSRSRARRVDDPHFEKFWSVYPRRQAKADARRAWEKLAPDDALTETILEAVRQAALTDQWRRDEGQYIPLPATYLNKRRWEDEAVTPLPLLEPPITAPTPVKRQPTQTRTEWALEQTSLRDAHRRRRLREADELGKLLSDEEAIADWVAEPWKEDCQ